MRTKVKKDLNPELEAARNEEEEIVLFATDSGEKYHTRRRCDSLINYNPNAWYKCKTCYQRTKEVIKNTGSSSTTRIETTLVLKVGTGPKKYHHASCTEMQGRTFVKDQRQKCLICEREDAMNKAAKS